MKTGGEWERRQEHSTAEITETLCDVSEWFNHTWASTLFHEAPTLRSYSFFFHMISWSFFNVFHSSLLYSRSFIYLPAHLSQQKTETVSGTLSFQELTFLPIIPGRLFMENSLPLHTHMCSLTHTVLRFEVLLLILLMSWLAEEASWWLSIVQWNSANRAPKKQMAKQLPPEFWTV